MEFNRWELKRIRHALLLAISWERSLIDSYVGEYDMRIKRKMPRYCKLPKDPDSLNLVRRSERNIEAFRKILNKTNTGI
jgi:hypothetical protein